MSELRYPWRVLGACTLLILAIFAAWELIELAWFAGADPRVLHVIYLVRGVAGALFTVSLAAWILYRGYRRGLEQAARHEREMIAAERLATTGKLAAGMAHEIGNPLDGAMECLRLVEEEPDPARRAELLATALEALQRIDRSIARFLGFARARALDRREVALDDVLREALELARPTLARQGVELVLHGAPAARLVADPDALVQVVLNLLLNAGQAGARKVELLGESRDAQVRIVARDDGPGVDPALGQTIYDPFVTGRPEGTGLGLAVCRMLVEAHGGTLAHGPSPEGGAQFEVELPR